MGRVTGRRLAFTALAVALTLATTGCDAGQETAETAPSPGGAEAGDRRFAELRIAARDALDYLDPALAYTVDSWSILAAVYVPPLAYKFASGAEGTELIPALAEDMPEITEDGTTYRFTLREGLRYSDGSPVKASDWEASIERLFLVNSPGSGFFMAIQGAPQFARTKKGDITGIVTNNSERTVEIRLEKPRGDFLNVLATLFAAVVPAGTPAEDRSTRPIAAAGPYTIERYMPSRTVTLARNPHWRGIEGFPDGNPNRVTFELFEDSSAALQSVIDGRNDYDSLELPVDRLGEVQRQYPEQVRLYPTANLVYYFVNTRHPPFNDRRARQALNHAVDREAVVRLFGGLAAPTQNVLPSTYPQYDELSLYSHDLEQARELVRASGGAGMRVTAWTISSGNFQKAGEYLVDVLDEIGYDARLRALDGSIYFTTIGNQRTNAQVGVAGWQHDYPHPLNWFDVLLNGNRITEEHNNNFSNADVPRINDRIEALKLETELTDDVNEQWADVDRMVVDEALIVPLVNVENTAFFASDMDLENCYVPHALYGVLYTQTCKKR